jgi:hypothetical protein
MPHPILIGQNLLSQGEFILDPSISTKATNESVDPMAHEHDIMDQYIQSLNIEFDDGM